MLMVLNLCHACACGVSTTTSACGIALALRWHSVGWSLPRCVGRSKPVPVRARHCTSGHAHRILEIHPYAPLIRRTQHFQPKPQGVRHKRLLRSVSVSIHLITQVEQHLPTFVNMYTCKHVHLYILSWPNQLRRVLYTTEWLLVIQSNTVSV